MSEKGYILALDQGTTSSRAILFDSNGRAAATAQYPLEQIFPRPGWVECDAVKLLDSVRRSIAGVLRESGLTGGQIAGIGITNQRETVILWERETGRPVYNAISWQCRRTAQYCQRLRDDGLEDMIRQKTGLMLDPYFSGTKLHWLFEQDETLRARAERGELLFGTVDSWLIWNLTGGAVHRVDYSNASRTLLFDIDRLRWDEELCRALEIPMAILPEPAPTSGVYGYVSGGDCDGVPICAAVGDQQAALFGQGCFEPGTAKNTYGTGCFTLMNTGRESVRSKSGLLTSVGWSFGGETVYVLEGSAFNAGSAIQWLRDECGILQTAHDADILAESIADNRGVYFVPAFTGLGAPYWDPAARGCFFGLTRGCGRAELSRAVLESIAFEVSDLVAAMNSAAPFPISELRVDGGACVSDFLLDFQAGLLGIPVERPLCTESTALGAAYLAGLAAGVWGSVRDLTGLRVTERVFQPRFSSSQRERALRNWHDAVELARKWGDRAETP